MIRPVTQLRSLFTYLFGGLLFVIAGVFIIVISFFYRGTFFEKLIKLFCKTLLFIAGIKVEIEGLENIDPDKQYIVMMNHVNIFDAFLLYSSFPGLARGVEEESHFQWPFYGWVMKRVGMIPISRKSGREAMESLKRAGKMIKENQDFSIAILPEGTRTKTGRLGNFKRGGFLLAVESGIDIMPVIQTGSFNIKSKGNWLIKPGRVQVVFEEPVSSKGFSRENLSELISLTRSVFEKYLN